VRFVDEVEIEVQGGHGGDGCVSFRREKFVPHGGPNGGSGGAGGSVILRVNPRLGTLLELRYVPCIQADNGEHGRGSDKNGRTGSDSIVSVPVGTVAFDSATGELVADLDELEAESYAAKGGRGGRGNLAFKSSTNRSPNRAQRGHPGQERRLRLELKLLADVGIIGVPNVGKSTLVSCVSAARPKIADYPFTTLVPSLGVVGLSDDRSFVIADIPGLVPGAASGQGLGSRFLKHVERTRALLHLLAVRPGEPSDPLEDFDMINAELKAHNLELAKRPQVVALNKADLAETREVYEDLRARFAERGIELLLLSGATRQGLDELKEAMARLVSR